MVSEMWLDVCVANKGTTSVACALARHAVYAAHALLDVTQVDSSPHLPDVVMLQVQRLVALFYQSENKNRNSDHQSKDGKLGTPVPDQQEKVTNCKLKMLLN